MKEKDNSNGMDFESLLLEHTLLQINQAENFEFKDSICRPYVADPKLAALIDSAFDKLERYFPEKKVFALDSIDEELRERMTSLYQRAGYSSLEEMFTSYGFEAIDREEVRKIRNEVKYTPGNEPEIIKPKVDSMLRRLNDYYPDHQIERSIQNEHKALSKNISGLYQWLGYSDISSFLKAYGYIYVLEGKQGRPKSTNAEEIIKALQKKYPDGSPFTNLDELFMDNPEFAGKRKTLMNQAQSVFGMSLAKYLKSIGLIQGKPTEEKPLKKNIILYQTEILGIEEELYYLSKTKSFHKDDYVEVVPAGAFCPEITDVI